MCGLWGFIGTQKQDTILSQVAREAARRGPHGYGVAYEQDGVLRELKSTARLSSEVERVTSLETKKMIGNSRLSTYGSYDDLRDFHPHFSDDHSLGIVHNGNVRNMHQLIQKYDLQLRSDCDTEVIAHLASLGDQPFPVRVAWAVAQVSNASPLAVLAISTESIVAIRRGHPLYVTKRPKGVYFCSRSGPQSELLVEGHAYRYRIEAGDIDEMIIPLPAMEE